MLRDHWYIIALCIVVSIISISEGHFFILGLFYIWTVSLWLRKSMTLPFVFLIIFVGIVSYMYLPQKVTPLKELSTTQTDLQNIPGKVASPLTESDKTISFEFKMADKTTSLVTYFKNDDSEKLPSDVQHGASCMLKGRQSSPKSATSPHQFDYQEYLWQQGIMSQFLLESPEEISCVNNSYRSYIYDFRQYLLSSTKKGLSEDTVQWLHALVLGDDLLLDDTVVDLFQRWGLSHILAISGLHIGIVVGLIYFCFVRYNLLTKEKTKIFLCIFLPMYALLAGGQPSVWRASLMVLIVMFLTFFKRKTSYTDLISITFLLLIVFDKHIIYHIGFQLSFTVTFGIILSKKWLAQSKSPTESLLKISFVSQMVILPLQLHYFSIFDPLSILLNLIVVPYFSLFVIPAMFIFLFLSFLPSGIVKGFEFVFLFIHEKFLYIIFWIDTHLHFPFIIGKLPLYYIFAYYIVFTMFMIAIERKSDSKAFLHGLFLCLYIIFLTLRPYLSPYGSVTMLDIGQGDAFIIEMPYRKGVYFIDIGAAVSFPAPEKYDREYRQIIRPYLYGQGISKIDAVFLSHEHLDHYGSLTYLVDDVDVDDIIISEHYEMEAAQFNAWTKKGTSITKSKQGDVIKHNETAFHVLGPVKKTTSPDDNSLVLYTEIGNLSWVFTGDIGKEIEKEIIKKSPHLKADVLKVAHHGSDTSSDSDFVERFNSVALISVGRNNMYGHPGGNVIQRLEKADLKVYRTDMHGTVQYRFKGDEGVFIPFITSVE